MLGDPGHKKHRLFCPLGAEIYKQNEVGREMGSGVTSPTQKKIPAVLRYLCTHSELWVRIRILGSPVKSYWFGPGSYTGITNCSINLYCCLNTSLNVIHLIAVLRIRIRDPVPFWPRYPGWKKFRSEHCLIVFNYVSVAGSGILNTRSSLIHFTIKWWNTVAWLF